MRGEGFRVVDFVDVRVWLQALAEVHAAVVAEIRRDGRVFFRLEVLNFLPPLDQNRKRRGLHAPDGQQCVIAQGKSAAGVHAHIRLRTALRAAVQAVVVAAAADGAEALLNRLIRHGGNPQAVERLLAARFFVDVAENQLPLAPRVGCADEPVGFRRVDEIADDGKLIAAAGNDFQGDFGGQNRQRIKRPALVLFIKLVRLNQRHQMPDRPRHDPVAARQAAAPAALAAKHAGNIAPHARFFRNDYCTPHR